MAFPANRLESALASLRAGAGSVDQLLQALADSQLWVPLPDGVAEGAQARLPVMVIDEQPYVVVYTSAEQYARGAGQQAHMVISGRELAGILAEMLGLAVNPGAEAGLPIRPEGVRYLRGGRRTIPAGQQIRLGDPAEEPQALLAALATAFEAVPAVIVARRALAQTGDEPPFLLIGVEADQSVGDWREAALAAANAAVAAAPPPLAVDTVFLDDATDPVTAWMLAHTEPFYRRPTG
ncbi:enhanced serine sensitivity protein SseB [Planosporangium flavigriseum]|uniref:Enhanced serine sensitivity protein SseB n=1 Tax=Planosporangium flavigriseum TaxID=373681 RepID=A0A8J3LNC0_9ACTN|nr:enhanced serine sensitivity protein SseB C-terminal domain-containing protein [Planosporangium flavigriseum]NJC66018.1 enhanced serine sensitivity protein SseB [Planosporangium flavigriseum]GIG74519.1 enhanced serine sensitivity protein SseB [Planosporangium flavigriseum]